MADFLLLVRDKVGALFVIPFKGNHSLAGNGYMRYLQVVNRYRRRQRGDPAVTAGQARAGAISIYRGRCVQARSDRPAQRCATARCADTGARVLLTFGVFPDGEYELNRKVIDATAEQLRRRGARSRRSATRRTFSLPVFGLLGLGEPPAGSARTARTRRLAELLAEAGVGVQTAAAACRGQSSGERVD